MMTQAATRVGTQFQTVLSLGRSCQCAHQLRRYTGDNAAYFFDWLGTPTQALMMTLQSEFEGCFELTDFVVADDKTSILNRRTGMIFRHLWALPAGRREYTAEDIRAGYATSLSKLNHLRDKWLAALRRGTALCVRHDRTSVDEAVALHAALKQCAADHPVSLLIVTPNVETWVSPHSDIFCETGVPLSTGPVDWQGQNQLWDVVLQKFPSIPRQATRRIKALANASGKVVGLPSGEATSAPQPVASPHIVLQFSSGADLETTNRMLQLAQSLREKEAHIRITALVDGPPSYSLAGQDIVYTAVGSTVADQRHSLSALDPDVLIFGTHPTLTTVQAAASLYIRSAVYLTSGTPDTLGQVDEVTLQAINSAAIVLCGSSTTCIPLHLQRKCVYANVTLGESGAPEAIPPAQPSSSGRIPSHAASDFAKSVLILCGRTTFA